MTKFSVYVFVCKMTWVLVMLNTSILRGKKGCQYSSDISPSMLSGQILKQYSHLQELPEYIKKFQNLTKQLLLSGSPGTSNLKLLKTDTFSSRFRSLDTSDQSRIQNESSDSEFSYDSDASDKTYIPKKDVSTDEETFETAPSEPSSNVASPEMSPVRIPIKKITRKKSFMTPTTPSPYNLRSRASLTSPFRSSLMPVPASESPETFGRIVQKMERISKKNATKLIETLQNSMQGTSYYSSDGEWVLTEKKKKQFICNMTHSFTTVNSNFYVFILRCWQVPTPRNATKLYTSAFSE